MEGGCIGERLCVHSGEGCVYMCVCVCVCVCVCIVEGVGGGVLCRMVCTMEGCVRALWEGMCAVPCYGHLDGKKKEGRMCLVDCVVLVQWHLVWPVAVLIGCVVLSGQWQF